MTAEAGCLLHGGTAPRRAVNLQAEEAACVAKPPAKAHKRACWRVTVRPAGSVVVGGLLIACLAAACSPGAGRSGPAAREGARHVAVKPVHGVRGSVPRAMVDPTTVVAAWVEDMRAYEVAGYTDDYNSPTLAASFTGTLLTRVRNVFYEWHLAGFSGRGSYSLGTPKVVAIDKGQATIASCIYGGVVQVGPDGKPVAGPPGQVDDAAVHATLSYVASTWKIAAQDFTVVPSCVGS